MHVFYWPYRLGYKLINQSISWPMYVESCPNLKVRLG